MNDWDAGFNAGINAMRERVLSFKRDPHQSFALPYTPPTEQDMRDAEFFSKALNSILELAAMNGKVWDERHRNERKLSLWARIVWWFTSPFKWKAIR